MSANLATLIAEYTAVEDLMNLRLLSTTFNGAVYEVIKSRMLVTLENIVEELRDSMDVALDHTSNDTDSDSDAELAYDKPEECAKLMYNMMDEYADHIEEYVDAWKFTTWRFTPLTIKSGTVSQVQQACQVFKQLRLSMNQMFYDFERATNKRGFRLFAY